MGKPKSRYEEYKCKLCGKRASDKAGLAQHMLVHTSEKPFSCELCNHTCKSKKYLNAHIKKVHKKATGPACKFCGKKFHFKSLLEKHLYTHTNERPYKCEICNKGFNSTYTLSTHRHIHSGEKPFKCEFCSYACRDSSTLRKHQERHMGITRLYQCTACDKSYKTKRVLKVHVGQAHMEQDMKTTPCPLCGKMFATTKNITNHIRVFHERLYECSCDICGIKLSNKYNMRAHLNKHMDFRPFECTFEGCNKKFKDKTTLKKHAIIHYPEKHFVCRVCGRRFTRIHRFKAHRRQHQAKVKCVVCDYCGKSFYNKNYVRSHIARAHVHPQRYQCDVCGLLTHNKPSIVMHLKYGHAADQDRQCKICKKTYKKHIYLKLHYWNTHCVKYKMNKHTLRRPKKIKNYIIEESEQLKEIEMLHEVKVEPASDSEEMKEPGYHRQGTETTAVSQVDVNKNFAKFFIEHVIMPSTSVSEFLTADKNIDVDMKTHKEAERFKREMLKQWKSKREMITQRRVKRRDCQVIERTGLCALKDEHVKTPLTNAINIEVPVKDESENNVSKKNEINNTDIHKNMAKCHEIENIDKETIHNNDSNYESNVIDKTNSDFKRINIKTNRLEFTERDKTKVDKVATVDGKTSRIIATIANDNLNDFTEKAYETSNDNIASVNIDSKECDANFDKNHIKEKDCETNVQRKAYIDFDNDPSVGKIQTDNSNIDYANISDVIVENIKEKALIEDEILNKNKPASKQDSNIKLIKDNNGPKNLRRSVRKIKRKVYNDCDSDDSSKNSKSKDEIKKVNIDQVSYTQSDSRQEQSTSMELLKTKRRRRNVNKKSDDRKSDADDDYKPDEDEETDDEKYDEDEENSNDNFEVIKVRKPLRRVRNVGKKGKIGDNDIDEDYSPGDERNDEANTSNGFKINIHQCYVCFKLYDTKEKLLDHCKEHFDICNAKMLKKCPLCEYVTKLDLRRHIRAIHKINLNILYGTLKDRKNNNNKSRFYFNVDNKKINEIEVIPSIKNLNRQAFLAIDRKRRENNDKGLKKTKLIKKDGEWIVEKESINAKDYVLPETVDKDVLNKDGDYAAKMQRLSRIAKKNGQKMLFPCNNCQKICQTLSALKLHMRRHDPNKKPFKKKVWKHKLSEEELKKREELNKVTKKVNENRYATPKPIINKHKCDPKLKDFYENNIKGGDIEFWQFLKIFNKMTRENVNDFSDLEKRTEFGNHFYHPKNLENILENEIKKPERNNGTKKLKEVNRRRVVNKFRFKRTIMISRKEYIRRKAIQEALRERILDIDA